MYRNTIVLLYIVLPLWAFAQNNVCQGNLGENIFEAGDFGSGTPNIPTEDPGIAPGYSYLRGGPPQDGQYVITNNTGAWPGNYGTWLDIRDNSSDPNGYMMVVNADFTPGLFYDQTVTGLCENTLYEFSADVINMIRRGVTGHIKPNVSFLIDEEEEFTTGEIPQDEDWHNYGFTFTTAPGQTSVQLSLRNNAPGGTGNDLALDNISFRACGPEALILPVEIANICEDGDPVDLDATVNGDQYTMPAFQWQESFDQGRTWSDIPDADTPVYTHAELSSGFYYYRYLLANGETNLENPKCRVISNDKIVYVVPKFYTVNDTICEGLTYEQDGNSYTTSGTYVDTLLSSIGCDSIVTLNLAVLPDANISADIEVVNPSCHDTQDGVINVETVNGGVRPYTFSLTGRPPSTNGSFSALAEGPYTLSIHDRYGCSFQEELAVQSPEEFFVNLGPDRSLTLGDAIQIQPQTNYPISTFSWDPPDVIDCFDDCLGQEWLPLQTQTLRLEATSERGCMASDEIRVTVDKQRRVYIPNAFSPNGDGINDEFFISADVPNVQGIRRLAVFDRWGNLLFEQTELAPNDPETGWDGKVLGQEIGEGVYVFFAEIVFLDGKVITYSGDLSLLR